jgi:hypothetical protein
MSCDHKFVDSDVCLRCGVSAYRLRGEAHAEALELLQTQKLELAKLRDAFDDAVALLRDWEDYEPDDETCTWVDRRDEFLKEHEEAGR